MITLYIWVTIIAEDSHDMKTKYILIPIFLIAVLVIAGYLLLSRQTFYADFVVERVAQAMLQIGDIELSVDDVSGNPMTGVTAGHTALTYRDVELMTAESIEMQVDMTSVIFSPKLSSLTIKGASAHLDQLLANMPKIRSTGKPPALDTLIITDSIVKSSLGDLEVERLEIELATGRYKIDARALFNGERFSASGIVLVSSGDVGVHDMNIKIADAELRANGKIAKSLDIVCEVSMFDVELIKRLVPSMDLPQVAGVYSGRLAISQDKALTAAASVSSPKGSIYDVPFESLAIDIYSPGNNIIEISNATFKAMGGAASLDVSLDLNDAAPKILSSNLILSNMNISTLSHILPWTRNYVGDISATASISGAFPSLAGVARITSDKIDCFGYAIENATADLTIKELPDVALKLRADAYGAQVNAAGTIHINKKITFDVDATLEGIVLEALSARYPQITKERVDGICSANAHVFGAAGDIKFTGTARADKLIVFDRYDVDQVNASFSYADKALDVTELTAHFHGAMIECEVGAVDKIDPTGGLLDFRGKFSDLDLTQMTRYAPVLVGKNVTGKVNGTWVLSGSTTSPKVDAAVTSDRISCIDIFNFSSASAKIEYQSGTALVSDLRAKLGKADVTAGGTITMPTDTTPISYDIKGKFDKVHAADYAQKLGHAEVEGELSGEARVWGRGPDDMNVRVFFNDSRIAYENMFDVSGVRGIVTLKDDELMFSDLRTKMHSGDIRINGKISEIFAPASADKTTMSISVSVSSADIGRISRVFMPNAKGYDGLLSADIALNGKIRDPQIVAHADLRFVRAFGLFFPHISVANIVGTLSELRAPRIEARAGRGDIESKITLTLKPSLKLAVEAHGRSVDLRSLTYTLDRETRRQLSGAVDFDFTGSGWLDSFDGSGRASIPLFKGMGLTVSDISAPFYVDQGFVFVEESTANAYGGKVVMQFARDLDQSRWGGRIDVKSADIQAFLSDFMPDMEGTVVGSTDVSLRIGGDSSRTSMLDGSGQLNVSNGMIYGFPATQSLAKIAQSGTIHFSNANIPFHIDGRSVHLLPGTRITAPNDDPLFRYVTLDGSVSIYDKEIDLSCLGNINLRALNSFVGGLHGLVSAAMQGSMDRNTLLQNFLGGALSGLSKATFRDVSLTVKGHIDDLTFDKLEIAQPLDFDARPEILNQTVNDEYKEKKFTLTVNIPVGPGGRHRDDYTGQVGSQIFEQAIKSLFNF